MSRPPSEEDQKTSLVELLQNHEDRLGRLERAVVRTMDLVERLRRVVVTGKLPVVDNLSRPGPPAPPAKPAPDRHLRLVASDERTDDPGPRPTSPFVPSVVR